VSGSQRSRRRLRASPGKQACPAETFARPPPALSIHGGAMQAGDCEC
jgi:hypothetical protein